MTIRRAIFLDRDGTVNRDLGYTHRIDEFEFLEGAVPALVKFSRAGFLLFIITNQAGVARGYYSLQDVQTLHQWVYRRLRSLRVEIVEFLVCPHHPDFTGPCECRKPSNLLIESAIEKYDLDRYESWMIGDRWSDEEAARRSRINFIGVGSVNEFAYRPAVVSNLIEAYDLVASNCEVSS